MIENSCEGEDCNNYFNANEHKDYLKSSIRVFK